MQQVDAEIRRIIDEQYALAEQILKDSSDKVEAMTNALMEWETIDAEQIRDIMEGRQPQPPKGWIPKQPPAVRDDDTPSGSAPVPTINPAPEA